MMMLLLQGKGRTCVVNLFPVIFMWHYLKYDNTDFSLKIAHTTRVMVIKCYMAHHVGLI